MSPSTCLSALLAVCLCGACGKSPPAQPAPPAGEIQHNEPPIVTAPDLHVEGSTFVLKLPDGRVLRCEQMQGALEHKASVWRASACRASASTA